MASTGLTGLTFGPCKVCHNELAGHAVFIDGVMLCSWCELDMAMKVVPTNLNKSFDVTTHG